MTKALNPYLMTRETGVELAWTWSGVAPPEMIGFFALFGTVRETGVAIEGLQQATPERKREIAAFVAAHGGRVPSLNAFGRLIRQLPDDAFFLVLPREPATTEERHFHERVLAYASGEITLEDLQRGDELFGPLLEIYDLHAPRLDRYTLIGHRRKKDRRCRFCDRTLASGARFDSLAHAIPVALGNRHLKLADECDDCNNHFGSEIEPHLVRLLDVQRVYLGIEGRGGSDGRPIVTFEHGTIRHDGQRMLVELADKTEVAGDGSRVKLGRGAPYVPARCYRALVKMALAAVPEAELTFLTETARWTRYGALGSFGLALPKVLSFLGPVPPPPGLQLAVHVRQTDDRSLPHVVGEFRLGPFVYVFVLPYSSKDEAGIENILEQPRFAELFRHYAAARSWTFLDFSHDGPVSPSYRLIGEPTPWPTSLGASGL